MGRCPRDPRVAPRGRLVGGGWRHAWRLASVPPGPVPGWPASGASWLLLATMSGGRLAGALVRWFSGWPAPRLGISARGGPRAGRSAAGGGASVRCGGPPGYSVGSTVGSSRCGWAGGAGGVAAPPAGCAASRVWGSGAGVGPGWRPTWPASACVPPVPSAEGCGTPVGSSRPGAYVRGESAGTVARVGSGSGSGSGFGAGHLPDGVSVGCTAGPAGGFWCCWDSGSACAGAGGWHPGADVPDVAGACGLGLSVGLWACGRMVPRGPSGRALVASVGVAVHVCVEGACVGPSVGRIGGLWCWSGSASACVAAASRAAVWWFRANASDAVWGHGAGLPVGPGPGLVCGCMVPIGCLGRVAAVAVFVGLGMVPFPAGEARRCRIALAAWCCRWCRCATCLDARSCRGLFVAWRPPMVLERPLSVWRRWPAVGVVSGRLRGGRRWTG